MKRGGHIGLIAAAFFPLLVACSRSSAPSAAARADRVTVVVTTSILECAVRDVGGEEFRVCRLVPPHSCPGHFDLTPADLERIVRAPLFIRHDYQAYLDARLSRAGKRPRRCISIPSQGAQTIPDNYIAVCREVYAALSDLAPDKASTMKGRLEETVSRVRKAGSEAMAAAAPIKGKVVIASRLQKDFCEWIGLRVAATFDNADQASLKGVERAVRRAREAGACAVVCNLQRGLREGKALAERLDLPLIVLSNFPEADPRGGGYTGLLRSNVEALIRGLLHE